MDSAAQPNPSFCLPPNRRQPGGFILSFLIHGGLAYVFVFSPVVQAIHDRQVMARRYSILVLRPQDILPFHATAGLRTGVRASRPGAQKGDVGTGDPGTHENRESTPAEPAPAPHPLRPFALPPVPQHGSAKQTLVELDVPPEIQLKHNIPLPAALLWEHLPPIRREFVAPSARPRSKPIVEMPSAPDLSPPNWEPNISNLKLSATLTNQNPKLVQPPSKTAPLKSASNEPVLEPPQISTNDPGGMSVAAVISLPETPLLSTQKVLVPPANQIATAGAGGTASSGVAHNSANGPASPAGEPDGHGTAKTSSIGTASQNPGSNGLGSHGTAAQGGGIPAVGASTGAGSDSPSGNSSVGRIGSEAGSLSIPTIDPLPQRNIPGTTRLVLPKDGKFSVIVSGSSPAGPYTESAGALSGKMVYSVYISVGLRKKWILQYCLPKTEEQKLSVRGRALPIEAPWPYVIVRPDSMSFGEYVIVHGILSPDGRFDQLALISPLEFDTKDLLMSSLKQWTFRPASRDGAPSQVEILLIIPGQSE